MGLAIDNGSDLKEAQHALFSAKATSSAWLLLNYVRRDTVKFATGGESGPEDLRQHLEDDQVQYALVRLAVPPQAGSLEPSTRDVFVQWIGPDVGDIEKGKKAEYLKDAQGFLQPSDAKVDVTNRDKLDTET
jgi:sarcosine oxidase gamma subunit